MKNFTPEKISFIYEHTMYGLLLLSPLLLLNPHQFRRDLFLNQNFIFILIISFFMLPLAIRYLAKSYQKSIIKFLIGYWIVLGISTITSTNFSTSAAVFLLNSSGIVLYQMSRNLLNNTYHRLLYVHIYLGVAGLLSVISVYFTVFRKYVDTSSEGLSYLWVYVGHNHLAVLLIPAILLTLYLMKFQKMKWEKTVYTCLLTLFFIALFWSVSRTVPVALVIAVLIGGIGLFIPCIKMTKKFMFLILLGLVALIILSGLFLVQKKMSGIPSRINQYQTAIQLFRERPIHGYGLGTYGQINQQSQNPSKHAFFVHNLLLQQLAEGGLILSTVWVVFIFSLLYFSAKTLRADPDQWLQKVVWIVIVAILINELADFDLQIPSFSLVFWILLGFLPVSDEIKLK